MSPLQWTDDLHVGNQTIDDQHKELFAIAADLVEAVADGQGEAMLKDIFTRLKEYTQFHFKEEEAYMDQIGYPKRDAHAAQHAILIIRVGTLKKMIDNGEAISPEGVGHFLQDWIALHIMQDDIDIESYARTQRNA